MMVRSGQIMRGLLLGLAAFAVVGGAGSDARAQLDTQHWVPALWASADGSSVLDKHWLIVTTPETAPVDLLVTDGAGTVIYQGTVSKAQPREILIGQLSGGSFGSVGPWQPNVLIGVGPLSQPNTAGLVITASSPVYANVRNLTGSQGTSLTAKGKKALGFSFRAGVMRDAATGSTSRGQFISVMATADGTTVTFEDFKTGVVFYDTPTVGSGASKTTARFSVTLDKHESYIIGFRHSELGSLGFTADVNDVNGTRVVADKPVAVASGGWRAGATSDNGQDIGVDELAPEALAGTQYILIKGNAPVDNPMETPMAVAVQNGTTITVHGATTTTFTADAGDYRFLDGLYSTDENMYVVSDKPILMFQTIGGSESHATPGFNFIPPLGVDSATFVDAIYKVEQLGAPRLGIISEAGAEVRLNGALIAEAPSPVPGTNGAWVTYKTADGSPQVDGDVAVTSTGTVAVALFNVNGLIGAAGYFSGFPPTLVDLDFDGVPDGTDNCPNTSNTDQANADGDAAGDACDPCPEDPAKIAPGECGCGVADVDVNPAPNGNGVLDCLEVDNCPADPLKLNPGFCGCGVPDVDTDSDGIYDCNETCDDDPDKTEPGVCGCGRPDADFDFDGVLDCRDNCPSVSNADQADCDGDGVGALCDGDGTECCANGLANSGETDVDCGGVCPATCTYGEGCVDGGDCASGVCLDDGDADTCGCAGPGTCPGVEVCDADTSLCTECLADGDCAGFDDACAPETCDADQQCIAATPVCTELVFYGVVEGPGGTLRGIRCTLQGAGSTPVCDMDGDVLALYEPMCGG